MHIVKYDHTESGWNEALPLGNGHFGGMAFFEDNTLTFAMNHYEVYYKKLHFYSNKNRNGEGPDFQRVFGMTFDEMKAKALEKYRNPTKGPFFLYTDALWNSTFYRRYGKSGGGASHYPTGELRMITGERLVRPDHYSLQLEVERACVDLHMEKGEDKLQIRTFVTQNGDFLVSKIKQTDSALLESVSMSIPIRRYMDLTVQAHQLNETTFYYTGSFYPDGEDKERYGPFTFLVMMKIIGAKGRPDFNDNGLTLRLFEAENSITLLTTVVTEEESAELLETADRRLEWLAYRLDEMEDRHRNHWEAFWKRSSITLPDKMLENLWYVNLYTIACSSGRGARMYEQSCGLNGLWDIKQPTKWGSSWYWDVNIQAAFWPLYTANHLEIAAAFNEGLLAYTDLAEKMAKQFHGIEGYSADYPFALYLSTWPWCAQFLWDYYQYSMDQNFLKEKAYPLFKRIVQFFEHYLDYDPEKDQYIVFPDISPEQGPVTRNSTITLASVKYLLKISIESNMLLGEDEAELSTWTRLLDKLAPYPLASSPKYGEIIKDSEWAPAELYLRHPSLLMPIFPIGEIDKHCEEDMKKRAENTLRYVEENTEIGVFQFGWLSCAASRLGKGHTALRLLYEQGIDLLLRPNGLFAEETERWINYCNITNEPLYYPHMMEGSGEVVTAINEMLLQSYDGTIDVFPAVPSGEPEYEQTVGLYDHEIEKKVRPYDKWDDCEFQRLLAVGAFEVSAVRKEGQTKFVKIKSLAGNRVVLRNPFSKGEGIAVMRSTGEGWEEVEYGNEGEKISFLSEKGEEFAIFPQNDMCHLHSWLSGKPVGVDSKGKGACLHVREAHTYRKVFLGKNRDTDYIKLLDHFTFDYYSGNYRESRTAVYRLDFGIDSRLLEKDYSKALPRQFHIGGGIGQQFRKISEETQFTPYSGIGWEKAGDRIAMDRGAPDELRRDFVGGTEEQIFMLELPRGRYDLLFVSGDNEARSYTEIEIEGQSVWKPDRILKEGEFTADILPVSQRKDGYLKIHLRTRDTEMWRINLLIINKNYTYL